MNGIKSEFEHYHQVKISDKTIETAIELADRYLPDRTMPDKVIDLMDEAASSLKIRAVGLRRPRSVSPKIIHDVISSWTHIPLQELRRREKSNLLRLESQLRKKIVGQNEAISQVARAIRRRRIGIGAGKRPSGVFLFIGPTGVGKTALAQTLAEVLFGSVQQLIRLDMSEFTEAHSSAKLIGAPPGYVGFGEGGVLTHAVRTKPYSVILLDEIEKAHPSIFNLLLQLFDEGRLTDSQGETTDFRNTIIIMTSNLIDDPEKGSSGIGFKKSETGATNSLKKQIFNKLSHYFQQELLNRLDDVVLFKSLSQHSLQQIVKMHIQHLNDDLALQGVTIEMTSGALASIVKKIDEDAYDGARALRRVIRNYVEDDITELILSSKIKHGDVIRVGISHGRVVLKNKAD